MAKCPFMPHLLLSVGGYSFAVWNEGVMVSSVPDTENYYSDIIAMITYNMQTEHQFH